MFTDRRTTPNRRRRRGGQRLAAVVAGGALLVAACGDDAEPTEDAAPAATVDEGVDREMMGAFGPACDAVPSDGEGSFAGMADDPAGTAASNNPLLTTLVDAVGQAELVDTLNSDGPFTIFAPTNDAFGAVPADVLQAVLADEELLTSVLTYHVVAGESLTAEQLGQAGTSATVEGGQLTFATDGTGVDGADVICSDVPVANGTVHIVDSVLLPQVALDAIAAMGDAGAMDEDAMADESMDEGAMDEEAMADDMMGAMGPACAAVPVEGEGSFAGMADDPAGTAASNNPLLTTLVDAVVQAELVDTLNSDGPFTIFAPTNDAFGAVPAEDLEAVLADTDLLTSVLTYHVVAGERLSAADLVAAGSATTVNGGELTFAADGGAVVVNGSATTICYDVPTANATVHIIDGVLLPAS